MKFDAENATGYIKQYSEEIVAAGQLVLHETTVQTGGVYWIVCFMHASKGKLQVCISV